MIIYIDTLNISILLLRLHINVKYLILIYLCDHCGAGHQSETLLVVCGFLKYTHTRPAQSHTGHTCYWAYCREIFPHICWHSLVYRWKCIMCVLTHLISFLVILSHLCNLQADTFIIKIPALLVTGVGFHRDVLYQNIPPNPRMVPKPSMGYLYQYKVTPVISVLQSIYFLQTDFNMVSTCCICIL